MLFEKTWSFPSWKRHPFLTWFFEDRVQRSCTTLNLFNWSQMETFKTSCLAVQVLFPPQTWEKSKNQVLGSHFPPSLLETFMNKVTHTTWFCKWESYRNVHNEPPRKANDAGLNHLPCLFFFSGEEKMNQFQNTPGQNLGVWCNCAGILNGVGLLGPNSPCQDMRQGQWRLPRCGGKGLRSGHMLSCWTRWNPCTDSWICSCLSVQA